MLSPLDFQWVGRSTFQSHKQLALWICQSSEIEQLKCLAVPQCPCHEFIITSLCPPTMLRLLYIILSCPAVQFELECEAVLQSGGLSDPAVPCHDVLA